MRNEIRTLVVDDSPGTLHAMCSVVAHQPNLTSAGVAHNGIEALAQARITHPDLVVLDLKMPVMGGIEAASRLSRDCPDARVIVGPAHDTRQVRRLCCDCGASGFIAKDHLSDELPPSSRDSSATVNEL